MIGVRSRPDWISEAIVYNDKESQFKTDTYHKIKLLMATNWRQTGDKFFSPR